MASSTLDPDAASSQTVNSETSGWLVGPWFDAFFIANVAWPLLVLLQFGDGFNGEPGVYFWQLYFITTPHRWITLVIVFLDGSRFRERRGTFLGLAAGALCVTAGVWWATGALTCLMAIDYLWNAWHFASQHHGIYRIYSRMEEAAPTVNVPLDKWALRGFLLYVILRVVSATWTGTGWTAALSVVDWFAACVPVAIVIAALLQRRGPGWARIVYLSSVCALYLCLLAAVHERRLGLMLALATASALFHAIEYLALVSWSVTQRHAKQAGAMGVLGHLAPRWGIALVIFVVILGVGAWVMDQWFLDVWLFLNVIVAYLHYAYDGLIWRRPAAS